MKKSGIIFFSLALIFIISSQVSAGKVKCTTIQSGLLTDTTGNTIQTGYDEWGYNYQAHIFNGLYDNYSRPDPPLTEDDTNLQMKWNDAWLSNKDCDGDGLLDRHYGYDSYSGSGAWLTNHMWGVYEQDGEECNWMYFVKIVAAPTDAVVIGGVWYTADEMEIGPAIWGAFAIIQEIFNDPCAGDKGVIYKSPAGPGFGKYKP